MHDRFVEMIVELEAVRCRAVAERGSRCGDQARLTDNRAPAMRAFLKHFGRHDLRPWLRRAEQRATERIEETLPGGGDRARRKAVERESVEKLVQLARRAANRFGFQSNAFGPSRFS